MYGMQHLEWKERRDMTEGMAKTVDILPRKRKHREERSGERSRVEADAMYTG